MKATTKLSSVFVQSFWNQYNNRLLEGLNQIFNVDAENHKNSTYFFFGTTSPSAMLETKLTTVKPILNYTYFQKVFIHVNSEQRLYDSSLTKGVIFQIIIKHIL